MKDLNLLNLFRFYFKAKSTLQSNCRVKSGDNRMGHDLQSGPAERPYLSLSFVFAP